MLFNHQILGVEWSSLNSVITWSCNTNALSLPHSDLANQSGSSSQNRVQILVKNEMLYTDLRTGESVNFRQGLSEESPISSAKISNLRFLIYLMNGLKHI